MSYITGHGCASSNESAYEVQSIDTIGRCEFSREIILMEVFPQDFLKTLKVKSKVGTALDWSLL